ncbi:hypothetical protein NKV53_10890 [Legionella sp. 27cVA30]|uniref:hypothetical protein n=1 Tax=Legionella sp. 27cVA30 TaxID=2905657 RepID=UPI00209F875B|nr:hypothetical protein [Legionella sp. 27cVA30]MCP0914831.1 hypothetical protein [Legionella sp. 27cVA30]
MPFAINFFAEMRNACAKQQCPDKNKNFFQNYADHLKFLSLEFQEKINALFEQENLEQVFKMLANETLARISVFDKIRDGYDYFDEVLGATVVPVFALGAFAAGIGIAIWQGILALGYTLGTNPANDETLGQNAAVALIIAGASILFGLITCIKSMLSLVTRPLVTLCSQSWGEQDKARFYNEEACEVQLVNTVEAISNVVADAVSSIPDRGCTMM